MCRQQKLRERLDGLQQVAAMMAFPDRLNDDVYRRVVAKIDSGEPNNLASVDRLLDRYHGQLNDLRLTQRELEAVRGTAVPTETVALSRTARRGPSPSTKAREPVRSGVSAGSPQKIERPLALPIGAPQEPTEVKLVTRSNEDPAERILRTPPVTPRTLSPGEQCGLVQMATGHAFLYCGFSAEGRKRLLDAHNRHRRKFAAYDDGVKDLQWSDELAQRAQVFAEKLVTANRWEHSNGPDDVGENLYKGPKSLGANGSPESVVDMWYAEIAGFDYDIHTTQMKPSLKAVVGHFTQVISRRSTLLGAGMAKSAVDGYEIWVCNYGLSGNMWFDGGKTQQFLDTSKVTRQRLDAIRQLK